jgi:cyanophycinase
MAARRKSPPISRPATSRSRGAATRRTATRATHAKSAPSRPLPRRLGRLLAIGGHEERSASAEILQHLVELAGGAGRAHVLICSGAMDEGREALREYQRVFESLGAATTTEALRERARGNSDVLLDRLNRSTAVFFTGGDQLQLTATMAGTSFGEAIRAQLQTRGLIVAGTSAGAAAMSSTMIVGGPSDGTVRRCDVDLAPGLGYWREALIDTHFSQRGRVNRLLTLLAENPQILGVGLDEDTAVAVTPGRGFRVLGSGVATVFDGRVQYTNAAEAARDEPLALFDTRLHVLPRGYGFDLVRRTPQLPRTGRRGAGRD